ncbi:MAG: CYTH domain-containing protein [Oscillospiraceae bacterium]
MENVEIERKWLMDGFPALAMRDETEMEQGYLVFEPLTVRIRKSRAHGQQTCWLTIKGRGELSRTEVETPLSAQQYAALVPLLALPVVKKRMRTYVLPGGEVLECSLVDEGEPTAIYYAEVEFESEDAARAFVPPGWLGREVTNEHGQSMAAYCRRKHGLPVPNDM